MLHKEKYKHQASCLQLKASRQLGVAIILMFVHRLQWSLQPCWALKATSIGSPRARSPRGSTLVLQRWTPLAAMISAW